MLINGSNIKFVQHKDTDPTSVLCPGCKKIAMFVSIGCDMQSSDGYIFGQRRCPDNKCCTHLFVVLNYAERLLVSYPASKLNFDSQLIPAPIARSLEEALTCHANECHTASAIMVRKTLELLCEDKSATGKNLVDRIKALSSKVMLPPELIEGFDHLRLLGNDAAHIECKTYFEIGKDELVVAIELTIEILKNIYQQGALIDKIKALQKPKAT